MNVDVLIGHRRRDSTTPHPTLIHAGILVADTDAVAATALNEGAADEDDEESAAIPARARVNLGGQPSCMAISSDGGRVAVAVGGKVWSAHAIFLLFFESIGKRGGEVIVHVRRGHNRYAYAKSKKRAERCSKMNTTCDATTLAYSSCSNSPRLLLNRV